MRSAILIAAIVLGASVCYATGNPWPTPLPWRVEMSLGTFLFMFFIADVVEFAGRFTRTQPTTSAEGSAPPETLDNRS